MLDEYEMRTWKSIALDGKRNSEFVAVAFLFTFTFCCFDADLLVIFFKCGKVFACFRKLTFLHALSDVPMHKRAFRIHQVEFMVNTGEDFGNCCGIADHATSTHYLCQISSWNNSRRLVVDTAFEPSGTPIDELDCALSFDGCDSCIYILGHHISTVHHATCHIFTMTRITLHEHSSRLEDTHCNLCHRQLFMVGLLRGDNR